MTKKDKNPNIPETVPCVYGELEYEKFKSKYSDVYSQVSNASHLLTGRVTVEVQLAGLTVKVQSLRPTEQSLLMGMFPTDLESGQAATQLGTYEMYKVAAALVSAGGTTYPALTTRVGTTSEEFVESLKDTVEAVNSMDPTLVSFISNVYEDMGRAKQLAFVENHTRP